MDVREKLVELLKSVLPNFRNNMAYWGEKPIYEFADCLLANGVTVQEPARPLEEWWEAYGDVLWWKFPIEEPPYVGSPLDENWPGYHTHWTPIPLPEPPKGE